MAQVDTTGVGYIETDSIVIDTAKRKIITYSLMAGGYTGGMVYLATTWYEQAGEGFRWFNDWEEWGKMDKLGHLYSGYHLAKSIDGLMRFTGVPDKRSAWLGAGLAFVGTGLVEVMDGYAPGFGASIYDIGANSIGIALHMLQRNMEYPLIIPKLSFHYTSYARVRPELLGSGWQDRWLKDYNGQTYWYAIYPYSFIPFWPAWITLDIGYSMNGMVAAREWQSMEMGYNPYPQIFISPGINFDVIGFRYPKLSFIGDVLNMIKFPFPALSLERGGWKVYPYYF